MKKQCTITAIRLDSMLYRPIRFLVTWFGVLAFLANTTVLGSGWVLCAEPDGQVAVEFAGDIKPCFNAPIIVCMGEEVGCAEFVEANAQCLCEPSSCKDTPIGIELAPLQKRIQLFDSHDEDPCIGLSSCYLPSFQYRNNDRFVALNFNAHPGLCAQIQSLCKVVLLI